MSDNTQQLAVLMADKANLPAFARTTAGADLNKEATAGTGGEGINRISLKQSRFRLIVGGEQVSVIQEPFMDVVIVRANPGVSRTFYTTKYDPNAEDQTPTCYSSNGVVPDPDAGEKQAATCAECPHSQWGSKINDHGHKVKACSEVKRLAIVPRQNVEAPMFQVQVPSASLKIFGNFVRMLNQASPAIPYNGIITRIAFDETSDYPKLTFEPRGWVDDEQYAVINERYESEEARRTATIVDVSAPAAKAAPKQSTGPTEDEVAAAEARIKATEARQAEAEKIEAEAKAKAAAEAKAEKAAKAKAKKDAEKAAASTEADPWGTATTAATKQAEKEPEPDPAAEKDAFAQAGWGDAAAEKATSTPPEKKHKEADAKVIDGDDIDSIFGAGFDD